MIPNPWFILGAVLVAIAAFFYGRSTGADNANTAWLKKENAEVASANAKILTLTQKVRDQEQAHAAAVNLISTTLEGEINAHRQKTEDLKRAARDGSFRLRDPAARKDACGSTPGGAAPGSGQRDGEKGAYLSAAASEFLFGLTGEADEVTLQLAACQAVVIDDRRTK